MSIYIMTHKPYEKFTGDEYKDLLVGAFRGHVYGDCFDDEGDNISEKNPNYCELTGLYWLWKHCTDDYIGLVHYRRYFSKSLKKHHVLDEDTIRAWLKDADVILPFRNHIDTTVAVQYCRNSGLIEDLKRLEQVILRLHPEYVGTYRAYMQSDLTYFFNMMIMPRDLFQGYCTWLFSILFELEKEIDLSKYNDYQSRIFGFISERLLNVWVLYHKLRVKECGVVNTEEKYPPIKEILVAGKRILRSGKKPEIKGLCLASDEKRRRARAELRALEETNQNLH